MNSESNKITLRKNKEKERKKTKKNVLLTHTKNFFINWVLDDTKEYNKYNCDNDTVAM